MKIEIRSRNAIIAVSLLVAGCATQGVRTPEEAKAIALSSVCAQRQVKLVANEAMPTEWVAERRGDRWYVSLPFGAGAQYPGIVKYGHMGAWISAKDGKLLYCESGVSVPITAQPAMRLPVPP